MLVVVWAVLVYAAYDGFDKDGFDKQEELRGKNEEERRRIRREEEEDRKFWKEMKREEERIKKESDRIFKRQRLINGDSRWRIFWDDFDDRCNGW